MFHRPKNVSKLRGQAEPFVKGMRGDGVQAAVLKPGKAAGAPVADMLNFLSGCVTSGHVFVSEGEHDHDAAGLNKFENVSSPERYERSYYFLIIKKDNIINTKKTKLITQLRF